MNKNSFIFTIILTAILTCIGVLGAQQFKLIIDGKDVKCDIIVKDGTTYLPLRTISDELGMELKFENSTIYLNTTNSEFDKVILESKLEQPVISNDITIPYDAIEKIMDNEINREFKYGMYGYTITKHSETKYVAEVIYSGSRTSQKMKTHVWIDILNQNDMINYIKNGGNKSGYSFGRSSMSVAAD